MYLDLVDKNEQVIVQRGKNKAYALTPITDIDRFSVNLKVIADIKEAEKAIKEGRVTKIRNPKDIWKDIL